MWNRCLGDAELERGHRPSGADDARELAQGRSGIVDVAEQVRDGECVELAVLEWKRLRTTLDEPDLLRPRGEGDPAAGYGEHLRALVDPDDRAAPATDELDRDSAGPGGDVQHDVIGPDVHTIDQESPPARILTERKQPCVAVVGRPERREQRPRLPGARRDGLGHRGRVYAPWVSLSDELEQVAHAALAFADAGEQLSGVLVAEPHEGTRVYLCAFEAAEDRRNWIVLDENGEPVVSRRLVRDAASIAALCEVAEETAGGGDLDELSSRLVALRLTESPLGIEEAEEAVGELQRTIGSPPRVASPGYLDRVGLATLRLEQALGAGGSPFAEGMKVAMQSVEEVAAEVETNYKRALGD